mmetsp:Transcript_65097/g.141897  ORF Transcript_65097/g.141897 Transcript_65097/m.141897 type:complete len:266 (+) Transcript_65097:923-1720(+)
MSGSRLMTQPTHECDMRYDDGEMCVEHIRLIQQIQCTLDLGQCLPRLGRTCRDDDPEAADDEGEVVLQEGGPGERRHRNVLLGSSAHVDADLRERLGDAQGRREIGDQRSELPGEEEGGEMLAGLLELAHQVGNAADDLHLRLVLWSQVRRASGIGQKVFEPLRIGEGTCHPGRVAHGGVGEERRERVRDAGVMSRHLVVAPLHGMRKQNEAENNRHRAFVEEHARDAAGLVDELRLELHARHGSTSQDESGVELEEFGRSVCTH